MKGVQTMEVIHALKTRRSIRKFVDGAVTPEQVNLMLDCAMLAPSAGNQQPWEFVVIDDVSLVRSIPTVLGFARAAAEGSCVIVVCGNKALMKAPLFWQQDCSAATQNILLAAHSLGLGSLWCGVYPNEQRAAVTAEWLKLPEDIVPMSLIVIGAPGEEKEQPDRFIAERIHKNTW
jgi:nitroreductase